MYGPAARYLLFFIVGVILVSGGYLPWWIGFGGVLCLRRPLVFFFLACLLCFPKGAAEDIEGKSVLVKIVDLPENRGASYRTTAEIVGAREGKKWRESRGLVQVYLPEACGPGHILEIPQGVQLLKATPNPYMFDYSKYLQRQGIFYRSFLKEGDYILKGKSDRLSWSLSARLYLHEVYLEYIGAGPSLGIAEAMVAGLRTEMEDEVEEAYIATGTVHALAVSGMHVAMLFWMLNFVLSLFLSRRSLWYMLLLLGALWSYAVFTGLSASVCRSVLMFSLFLVGDFLRRSGSSLNTLFISALVLLMIKPQWLFDVGFQLSYLAVWGILEFNPILSKKFKPRWVITRYLWESTTVTLSATLYTLPLSVYYFHQFPNYFLVANPLVNLICTPLLPMGLVLLLPIPAFAPYLGMCMRWLIELMNGVVSEIASWPGAITGDLAVSGLSILLSYFVILLFQRWLSEREPRVIWLSGIFVFFLLVQEGRQRSRWNRQEELIFHEAGFSIVSGRKEINFSVEPGTRMMKNYRREKGILVVERDSVVGNFQVDTKWGRVICFRKKQNIDLESATFVLISNDACPPEQLSMSTPILLDKTNSRRYKELLEARGLKVLDLRALGMKIFTHEQII